MTYCPGNKSMNVNAIAAQQSHYGNKNVNLQQCDLHFIDLSLTTIPQVSVLSPNA